MMNTCIRCQARVRTGRKYYTAHFMDALAEYEAAMAVYQQNMAFWNSMSAEEHLHMRMPNNQLWEAMRVWWVW